MAHEPEDDQITVPFVAAISDATIQTRVPRSALEHMTPREVLREAIAHGVASNPVVRGAFERLAQGHLDFDRELEGTNETERVLDRPGALASLVQGTTVSPIIVLPEARGAASKYLRFTSGAHAKVRAIQAEANPDEVMMFGLAASPDAPISDIYVFDGQWVTPVSCRATPEVLKKARAELKNHPNGLVPVACLHTHNYMPARFSGPDHVLGEVMGALLHPGTAHAEEGPDGGRWVAHSWNAVTNDRDEWQCAYDARGWCSRCGAEERGDGPVDVPVEVLPPAEGESPPDLEAVRRTVRQRLRREYGPRAEARAPRAELAPAREEALADDSAFEADRASLLRNIDALRGRLVCVGELWGAAPGGATAELARPLDAAVRALHALGEALREGVRSWD
ncbi:MAG: hypothetical protein HY909_27865 [Deltaproteobacteria bacterium]|nr:hypothetical protein [Deltaproteobacteria bacterium]